MEQLVLTVLIMLVFLISLTAMLISKLLSEAIKRGLNYFKQKYNFVNVTFFKANWSKKSTREINEKLNLR